jgi:hypothetical protein
MKLGSTFVSAVNVPTTMSIGETRQIQVTFKNNGTDPWSAANDDKLGSVNPLNNITWSLPSGNNRVPLNSGEVVAVGISRTFVFNIVAPATGGTYNLQLQMARGTDQWFGEPTTNFSIVVVDAVATCKQAALVSVDSLKTAYQASINKIAADMTTALTTLSQQGAGITNTDFLNLSQQFTQKMQAAQDTFSSGVTQLNSTFTSCVAGLSSSVASYITAASNQISSAISDARTNNASLYTSLNTSWTNQLNSAKDQFNARILDTAKNNLQSAVNDANRIIKVALIDARTHVDDSIQNAKDSIPIFIKNNFIYEVAENTFKTKYATLKDNIKSEADRVAGDAISLYAQTLSLSNADYNNSIQAAITAANQYVQANVVSSSGYSDMATQFNSDISTIVGTSNNEVSLLVSQSSDHASKLGADFENDALQMMDDEVLNRPIIRDIGKVQGPAGVTINAYNDFVVKEQNVGKIPWTGWPGVRLVDNYKKELVVYPDNPVTIAPGSDATVTITVFVPKTLPPTNYNIGKNVKVYRRIKSQVWWS